MRSTRSRSAQLYAVAFLTGTFAVIFDISHMTLYVSVTRREDYVEANSLLNGSRAFSYVAGPSVGGILVQILSAPAALLAGRVLLRCIGSLPQPDPGRGASARARRGQHVGPDEGGDALHPRTQHPAPVARVGGDAQLLQLRLRGALHPLCDPRAARALGDARDRPRRRRDRRPARGGRGRAPHPSFRDRAHLRLRDGALPGTAPARPPGGRAQDRRSRHALHRRVSLWA